MVVQKDYKNLQGRSAVLDCVARDSDGKQMDVEIQQDNEGASPKRARYHSGLMDMNTLNPGQDFDELPESYVIFITRDDVLGYGLPIYHVNRKIEEVSENFRDEAHIIYVNSKKQDDTELGRLMHDLHCKNAGDMHSKDSPVSYFESVCLLTPIFSASSSCEKPCILRTDTRLSLNMFFLLFQT